MFSLTWGNHIQLQDSIVMITVQVMVIEYIIKVTS